MFQKEKLNFLDFDIYSRRISFYYKHKEKFGTTLGFILTILYIILSLIIFTIYFVRTIKRQDVTVSISSIYPTEIPSIEINSDIFYISFGLEHSNKLSKFIDESIYYPEVLYIELIKEKGEYIKKSEQILNIERCDIEKFGVNYQHLLENDNLYNSYCLKDVNMTLKGSFQFNEMSYIKINIYPCANSTDNNNHCKPQNIINDYLQSAYFSLRIKDIGFSPFNYSFPTLPIIRYFNTALSKSIFKEYIMYFGIAEINTDVGLLFNKIKKETFLKYTRDFHTFYFQDSEKYLNKEIFSTQIMLEDYIYHQKRTFTKMSAVLSTTGGYMQFISTIFAIIALLTKKFSLELKLLNSLFNFNIKQRKIILSIEYQKKMNYNHLNEKGKVNNNFILYEPRKSIISRRSRRDGVLMLNTNNNNLLSGLKRSVTMQNPNLTGIKDLSKSIKSNNISKEGSCEIFQKISKEREKEDLNNRSKVNMIAKEDELNIEQIMKNKLNTKLFRKRQSNYSILDDLKMFDNGRRSTINFTIFDYYCLKKINKNKKLEIDLFNFGINFFKNQMDIINFFNIIILTQIILTQQADKKRNLLNKTIELYMK